MNVRWVTAACVYAIIISSAYANKWTPHIELEAKPGTDRSVGKADFFAPLMQDDDTLAFALARGVLTDDPTQEGNLGIGLRQMIKVGSASAIVGVYGFYDVRNSENNNIFHQVTLGGEILTEHFEFRGNLYLPENKSYFVSNSASSSSSASVSGTSVVSTQTTTTTTIRESSLPGFDLEAGLRADVWNAPKFGSVNIGFYGGYFDFERDNIDISGPRGRLEVAWNDPMGWDGAALTVGAEYRDDEVRGDNAFGFARLRIPLGKAGATGTQSVLDRRMTRRVVRDTDIVTGNTSSASSSSTTSQLTDAGSGQTIEARFVQQGAGATTCTQANPCSLTTAEAASDQGDLIVLLAGGGDIATSAAGVVLAQNEQVIGSNGAGSVTTSLSDSSTSSLTLSGLGSRPTLDGSAVGNDVGAISVNSGTQVRGIRVTGRNIGIRDPGTAVVGLTIDGVLAENFTTASTNDGSYGIFLERFQNHDNITITNSTVNNISNPAGGIGGAGGITIGNAANVTLTGNTAQNISAAGQNASGIVAALRQGTNSTVVVSNNTVDTVTAPTNRTVIGLNVSNNLTVGTGGTVTITNNSISNLSNSNGAEDVNGLYMGILSGTTVDVSNNTFNTISNSGAGTGFAVRFTSPATPSSGATTFLGTATGTGNTATSVDTPCLGSPTTGSVSFSSPATTC